MTNCSVEKSGVLIALALLITILAGCSPDPPNSGPDPTPSTDTSSAQTSPPMDASVGQVLSDNTPFGSPPKWVFQGKGGWSIDHMDGSTSQMTQADTGCHLTLQARSHQDGSQSDEEASRAEVERVLAEMRARFAGVAVKDHSLLTLRTLPTSKDPNTAVEFVRTQIDYSHAAGPKGWVIVLAVRAFVADRVILELGYSCPKDMLGTRKEVDALLKATARINSE